MKKITVILGTAHGVNVAGKCSPDGKFREYAFSREICKRVKTELEKLGYEVYIDKIEDKVELPQSVELSNRVNIVNNICKKKGARNCVYVSIHVNAAGNGRAWYNASGFSVFVSYNASDNSKKLATMFGANALRRDLCGNRSMDAIKKYYTANLYVLRKTSCPAVLTENMFQDNKKDVEFLMSEEGKKEIVDLHVETINSYCQSI